VMPREPSLGENASLKALIVVEPFVRVAARRRLDQSTRSRAAGRGRAGPSRTASSSVRVVEKATGPAWITTTRSATFIAR